MNASAWAFMLTGRVLTLEDTEAGGIGGMIRRVVQRIGEPVIRTALRQGMRVLARQFVMGRTIERGPVPRRHHRGQDAGATASTCSAKPRAPRTDAARYMRAYRDAIAAIGRAGGGPWTAPAISVKLSALHPRYEPLQAARCVPALVAALTELALRRKDTEI